jgi:hypothetical protein
MASFISSCLSKIGTKEERGFRMYLYLFQQNGILDRD